jgi:DNA-binding NarL/FixJ family response regulator
MPTVTSRIWIDEGDSIFRRGLGEWLAEYGFVVAGQSAGLEPAPALEDVDILLFELDAIDAVLALPRPPSVRLVALTASERSDRGLVFGGDRLAGLVVREGLSPESLASSLSAVANGHGSVPIQVLGALTSEVRDSRDRAASTLHEREVAVLRLLADGGNTNDIASELAYSERTVKNIVHDLLVKLGCRTRAHAVALATRHGVI